MDIKFVLLARDENFPINARNSVYLAIDKWNDYSYVTMFYMTVFDEKGQEYNIGHIKIGFEKQITEIATYKKIIEKFNGKVFNTLPEEFFSLGQDVDFYIKIWKLPDNIKIFILENLNDIVYKPKLFKKFTNEDVLKTSLMRDIRKQTIQEQFRRILEDKSPLSEFNFYFIRSEQENIGEINLEFNVVPNSMPSSNIHAIIGRNGVGKTTLLNGMIKSFIDKYDDTEGAFYCNNLMSLFPSDEFKKISDDYFSYLIAVSFSVFDPFIPNQKDLKYYSYIGLKESNEKLKEPQSYFEKDFWESFSECKSFSAKKERWLNAIKNLESDVNFSEIKLSNWMNDKNDTFSKDEILNLIKQMSSGHASVLLIITQLVARVEEKTLVLLDEPESHLHPPLLSAFIRALSELLDNRNGIAIIATHSPVVLQEIPKSCVWKIERTGIRTDPFRPNIETFGENVGVLTREVFGLEVIKSGFHRILTKKVEEGGSYDEIISEFQEQLGSEAKILLRTLIKLRDSQNNG
ncbi:cytochrome c biogenesis protein CcmA [Kingella potus]|uniref:Cytochrome c biogenesis protein CcmA n=1 Tax=Kingella potus TaxID=265175 RepID=A0A377R159_9NEIS|nr:AAA family ATPase [Kingella potus]UOP00458.1 ATP-binding protein [Kingella potus]STR02477.1 cytochrome c biogenesis protein CcmA [Kingella potus]